MRDTTYNPEATEIDKGQGGASCFFGEQKSIEERRGGGHDRNFHWGRYGRARCEPRAMRKRTMLSLGRLGKEE